MEFHGHTCSGLAIGFRAARVAMERLRIRKAPDEELVAVVETDACGADAIQVMTGCTFGKGNFIFKNYGKHAFTIADRKTGRAVRISLRFGALESDPKHLALLEKMRNDEAYTDEESRLRNLNRERARKILEADVQDLFKVEEIALDIPSKARMSKSKACDLCGEPTMVSLLRDVEGKNVCIPCMQKGKILRKGTSKKNLQAASDNDRPFPKDFYMIGAF